MRSGKRTDPEWRDFERLIARIKADAGPKGLVVTSPDRVRCKLTGRLREVDASIRAKAGTADMLITLECRRRAKVQDVAWIEQLATKRASIGADKTIAVSRSGFSEEAEAAAYRLGISLRKVSDVSVADLGPLLGLDLVVFWHKECAIAGVGVRTSNNGVTPQDVKPCDIDYILKSDTDLFDNIFHKEESGERWSINDIWREVQGALNPFDEIEKAAPPSIRTARIS